MAEKNNAVCAICGEPYHICLSCKSTMSATPWKVHCDTAEHYKIFQVVRGYNTGVYTKDEAKVKLNNIDLSDLNNLRPHIKSTIENILKEPIVEEVEKIESMVVEEETPVSKKTASRKKSYKFDEVEE